VIGIHRYSIAMLGRVVKEAIVLVRDEKAALPAMERV